MSQFIEDDCGILAHKIIKDAGGIVTFDEYDALMKPVKYWKPMEWGYDALNKDNSDKLCVAKACKMNLVRQTDVGYEVSDEDNIKKPILSDSLSAGGHRDE